MSDPISPFTWPESGSAGLRALIRRFNSFPLAVRQAQPLWVWLLQGSTPFGKFHKSWVGYSNAPVDGKCCGNCNRRYTHGVTDTTICDTVRGVWKIEEYCRYWKKAQDAKGYRASQEGGNLPGQ